VYEVTVIGALALAIAVTFPTPVPPDVSHLARGYHVTPHGCVVVNVQRTPLPPQPPSDPRVRGWFPGHPDAYDAYVANYAYQLGKYSQAITAYQRALSETKSPQYAADASFRLPLSLALYRAHQIGQAKLIWRTLLAHQQPAGVDPAIAAFLNGQFHDAFVKLAMLPPPFNSVTFGDDGSAYNLQRGLNAAARGNMPGAKKFLGYSVECDSGFQVPHLALGLIAATARDYTTARHEWLAVLEGWDPSTMPGVTNAQYDAIRLLLQYD
jgi:tetratricopeptide (TPR) repeat protein